MNIALIRLSALGDIIHTSIVVQFIKKKYKNARITWFADAKFAEILAHCKGVDAVIALPLKEKKYRKSYKILHNALSDLSKNGEKFDYIIDFQGLLKSALVGKILGNTAGFDKNSIKEPLAALFYTKKIPCDYNENIIVRNLTLAAKTLDFDFLRDEILQKESIFEVANLKNATNEMAKNAIIIAPFSSEESKNYAHFDAVIELLKAGTNHEIFISTGGKKEREMGQILCEKTGAKLLPQMNLGELVSVVSNAKVVVGNDSGVTHLAWACNTPSVVLFGNRPSGRNAYATSVNLVLDAGRAVDARHIDKKDFCINEISPKKVAESVLGLLMFNE